MKPYELQFNAQSHFDSSSWIPFHRRKAARLEIEGQNDEETPGDIILQARDEAIAQRVRFDHERFLATPIRAQQSAPALPSSSPIPNPTQSTNHTVFLEGVFDESSLHQERAEDPLQRSALHRGLRNSEHAQNLMIRRYNKGKKVRVWENGEIVTVKIPKQDRPAGTHNKLFARILQRKRQNYQLQTRCGVINKYVGCRQLGWVNPALYDVYSSDLGNNITKISMRTAARDGRVGAERHCCTCKKMPCGNRCGCVKQGVQCTIYCHGRTRDHVDCPHNAQGPAYHVCAIVHANNGAEGDEVE
jgi:hypothetical protein